MQATIVPRLLIFLPFLFVIMLLLSPRDQKGEKPSFLTEVECCNSRLQASAAQYLQVVTSRWPGTVTFHLKERNCYNLNSSQNLLESIQSQLASYPGTKQILWVSFWKLKPWILSVQVMFQNNTCTIKLPDKGYFPSVIKVKKDVCSLILSKLELKKLFQTDCDGRLGNQLSVYATAWVTCH